MPESCCTLEKCANKLRKGPWRKNQSGCSPSVLVLTLKETASFADNTWRDGLVTSWLPTVHSSSADAYEDRHIILGRERGPLWWHGRLSHRKFSNADHLFEDLNKGQPEDWTRNASKSTCLTQNIMLLIVNRSAKTMYPWSVFWNCPWYSFLGRKQSPNFVPPCKTPVPDLEKVKKFIWKIAPIFWVLKLYFPAFSDIWVSFSLLFFFFATWITYSKFSNIHKSTHPVFQFHRFVCHLGRCLNSPCKPAQRRLQQRLHRWRRHSSAKVFFSKFQRHQHR